MRKTGGAVFIVILEFVLFVREKNECARRDRNKAKSHRKYVMVLILLRFVLNSKHGEVIGKWILCTNLTGFYRNYTRLISNTADA